LGRLFFYTVNLAQAARTQVRETYRRAALPLAKYAIIRDNTWAARSRDTLTMEKRAMTMRLISKVKPGELAERPGSSRWKAQHPDGAVTYHKTLKDAKEYWHTSENTASYLFRQSIVDATWAEIAEGRADD
jgi:hypothetical protein